MILIFLDHNPNMNRNTHMARVATRNAVKTTLSLDSDIKERGVDMARQKGTSLSRLFEDLIVSEAGKCAVSIDLDEETLELARKQACERNLSIEAYLEEVARETLCPR